MIIMLEFFNYVDEREKVKIITNLEDVETKSNALYIRLMETNTIWLLSIDTSFSECDVEDGKRIQKKNDDYIAVMHLNILLYINPLLIIIIIH